MFKFDPNQRITSGQALDHVYFQNEPKATDPKNLKVPKFSGLVAKLEQVFIIFSQIYLTIF